MKPFNLEDAKAGKNVVLKDGTPVRIICFDAKGDYPIVALIGEEEFLDRYSSQGWGWTSGACPDIDLFMASEKKGGWVVLVKNKSDGMVETFGEVIWNSEEQAVDNWRSRECSDVWMFISAVKIEWEE